MLARVYLLVRLSYAPFGVDDVGYAAGSASRRLVARAIGQTYLSIGITEQAEGKIVLFGEGAVFLFAVETDSEHFYVLVGVLLDSITEPNPFYRSARRVRPGIKPQHDVAPAQIAEPHFFAGVRPHGEIRGLLSDF